MFLQTNTIFFLMFFRGSQTVTTRDVCRDSSYHLLILFTLEGLKSNPAHRLKTVPGWPLTHIHVLRPEVEAHLGVGQRAVEQRPAGARL